MITPWLTGSACEARNPSLILGSHQLIICGPGLNQCREGGLVAVRAPCPSGTRDTAPLSSRLTA